MASRVAAGSSVTSAAIAATIKTAPTHTPQSPPIHRKAIGFPRPQTWQAFLPPEQNNVNAII